MNWKQVKVRYRKTDNNGKEKSVTEPYLVNAMSNTEAEAKTVEKMQEIVSGEFIVKDITHKKFEVCTNYVGEWIWEVKVKYIGTDEATGKERSTTMILVLLADDIKQCIDNVDTECMIGDYEIIQVKRSNIIDIFEHQES